jgi:hypothetical protein
LYDDVYETGNCVLLKAPNYLMRGNSFESTGHDIQVEIDEARIN